MNEPVGSSEQKNVTPLPRHKVVERTLKQMRDTIATFRQIEIDTCSKETKDARRLALSVLSLCDQVVHALQGPQYPDKIEFYRTMGSNTLRQDFSALNASLTQHGGGNAFRDRFQSEYNGALDLVELAPVSGPGRPEERQAASVHTLGTSKNG